MDLLGWWKGMQGRLPQLARLAIRTLSFPHSAAEVERCNNHYKMTRSEKQHSLKEHHHLGHLSLVMNGVVPPVAAK